MKKILLLALILLTTISTSAQINMADSTAQVIAYWDKGEKQAYRIITEKFKIKDSDTISKKVSSYDVDITVLDSTKNSYTVQWLYSTIKSNEDNNSIQKVLNLTSNMKVIFKTDELGAFVEVVNWKEIRDYIQKSTKILQNDVKKVPELVQLIKQLEKQFSTKEAIESASIKDIQQFHTFHGANYKLGEILEANLKVPNIFGLEPFDSHTTVFLDEINEEDANIVMRATQEIDSDQLTDATFNYLTEMSKTLKVTAPKRSEFVGLSNETDVAARIHSNGWPMFSIQTTKVTADNSTTIEQRKIEIK